MESLPQEIGRRQPAPPEAHCQPKKECTFTDFASGGLLSGTLPVPFSQVKGWFCAEIFSSENSWQDIGLQAETELGKLQRNPSKASVRYRGAVHDLEDLEGKKTLEALPFPPNWEMKVDSQGRVYFTNVKTGAFTYDDPRYSLAEGMDAAIAHPPSVNLPGEVDPSKRDNDSSALPSVTFTWIYNWIGCTVDSWNSLRELSRKEILTYKHNGAVFNQAQRNFHRVVTRVQFLLKLLECHSLFLGYGPTSADTRIRRESPKSYMIRLSCTIPGRITLTRFSEHMRVSHHRLRIFDRGVYQENVFNPAAADLLETEFLEALCNDERSYLRELPLSLRAELFRVLQPQQDLKLYRQIADLPFVRGWTCLRTESQSGYDIHSGYVTAYS